MKTISRRAVLRGAGAMAALPLLEGMTLGAQAAKPPLRMGIVSVTGGTVLESWKLPSAGPLAKLSSILRPLEPVKEDLLVLTGLTHHGKGEGVNGHEHAAFLHLTGANEVRKVGGKVVASKSVDQAAAELAGEQTFLPSLEIGMTNHETRYSFRTPDQPLSYESNPRLVFDRMFRGRAMAVPNWKRRGASQAAAGARADSDDARVVDLVREEAARLRASLGRNDRQALDEYLESLGSIEKRVRVVDQQRREAELDSREPGPSKLAAPARIPAGAELQKLTRAWSRDPEAHAEYTRLMADLMVLAFQTDTTRVVTFAMGSDEALFPGVVTVGYERHAHTLEHQGNADRVENADPIAREACREIHAWYTELFAEMIRKMKAIDEGGSSLLDNSMILYTSYMADGGHGRQDYPVCLAGRAGGTLKTGRQVDFPKGTPASNLYVELLDRMGVKAEGFGESRTSPKAAFNGRLPGLA